MMPIDCSTDPPLRDLTLDSVVAEFGPVSSMAPNRAYDVLCEINSSPPWMRRENSGDVIMLLIKQANILNDLDELTNLGLEDFAKL
jgi:hypothetical protein